ncbi:MAG: matrixin family metalloprotease [Myxococcaceae bacterium]
MRSHLATLVALTLALPAFAWDLRTDSEGDVVRWVGRATLTIDASLDDELHATGAISAVQRAIAHVDEATPALEVTSVVGAAKAIGYVVGATDNTNSVIVLDDWPYSEKALAVTLVTLNARTNEILDADVAFNAEAHKFRVLDGSPSDGKVFDDVQNTITHELGHVLGLMHNDGEDDLVMFPSAPPGELIKRQLKQDDRDGLLSLYADPVKPVVTTPMLPAQGCSAAGPSTSWAVLAFALALFARAASHRRRRLAVRALVIGAALAPMVVLAGEPEETTSAADVALVTVGERQSFVHPGRPGLILTRLGLAPVECLKGQCASLDAVIVPGGRLGDLEQVVVHEPVPRAGETVLVTRAGARVRVLHLEPARRAEVLRLLRESRATPATPSPQPSATQSPATTR